jgi:hypothetical protein
VQITVKDVHIEWKLQRMELKDVCMCIFTGIL